MFKKFYKKTLNILFMVLFFGLTFTSNIYGAWLTEGEQTKQFVNIKHVGKSGDFRTFFYLKEYGNTMNNKFSWKIPFPESNPEREKYTLTYDVAKFVINCKNMKYGMIARKAYTGFPGYWYQTDHVRNRLIIGKFTGEGINLHSHAKTLNSPVKDRPERWKGIGTGVEGNTKLLFHTKLLDSEIRWYKVGNNDRSVGFFGKIICLLTK